MLFRSPLKTAEQAAGLFRRFEFHAAVYERLVPLSVMCACVSARFEAAAEAGKL